jgi:hypothetical protein
MPVSADSSNMSFLLEKGWFSMDFHALNSYYQDRNNYCSFLCCRLYNPYFCWHYTRKGLKFQDIFVVIFSVLAGLYNLGYIEFSTCALFLMEAGDYVSRKRNLFIRRLMVLSRFVFIFLSLKINPIKINSTTADRKFKCVNPF